MLRLNVVWRLQNLLGSGNLKKPHWNFSTKHTNFNYKMQLLRPLRKNLENLKNTSYVLVAFHHFNYCLDCIKCGFFCVVFFYFLERGWGQRNTCEVVFPLIRKSREVVIVIFCLHQLFINRKHKWFGDGIVYLIH